MGVAHWIHYGQLAKKDAIVPFFILFSDSMLSVWFIGLFLSALQQAGNVLRAQWGCCLSHDNIPLFYRTFAG
ncbi:MAG: hypothetical protein OQK32_01740 [Gammaproteobacteria bacterium]|nr:hypothetical protein [Gammaproteobacteria bacterium]